MNDFSYRFLPSGNSHEFSHIDEELIRRNVNADISEILSGGRIYRIPNEDLSKLPHDEAGPYLGDEITGYSLFKDSVWEECRKEWNGSDWRKITDIL